MNTGLKRKWYGTFLDYAINHDKLWMAASKDGELLDDRHVCIVSSQHVFVDLVDAIVVIKENER